MEWLEEVMQKLNDLDEEVTFGEMVGALIQSESKSFNMVFFDEDENPTLGIALVEGEESDVVEDVTEQVSKKRSA